MRMLNKLTCTLYLVLSLAVTAQAFDELFVIDAPTAVTLRKGQFMGRTQLFSGGGMAVRTSFGVSDRFMFGVSYSGVAVISDYEAEGQNEPGLNIKYRLIDSAPGIPAVAIGYDNQGEGALYDNSSDAPYKNEYRRYRYKSKGFYLAITKDFNLLNGLEVNALLNKSTEDDDDSSSNATVGLIARLNPELFLLTEYDFGLDDDNEETDGSGVPKVFGNGNGYLSCALRWAATDKLSVDMVFRNLTDNNGKRYDAISTKIPGRKETADRGININYKTNF